VLGSESEESSPESRRGSTPLMWQRLYSLGRLARLAAQKLQPALTRAQSEQRFRSLIAGKVLSGKEDLPRPHLEPDVQHVKVRTSFL